MRRLLGNKALLKDLLPLKLGIIELLDCQIILRPFGPALKMRHCLYWPISIKNLERLTHGLGLYLRFLESYGGGLCQVGLGGEVAGDLDAGEVLRRRITSGNNESRTEVTKRNEASRNLCHRLKSPRSRRNRQVGPTCCTYIECHMGGIVFRTLMVPAPLVLIAVVSLSNCSITCKGFNFGLFLII